MESENNRVHRLEQQGEVDQPHIVPLAELPGAPSNGTHSNQHTANHTRGTVRLVTRINTPPTTRPFVEHNFPLFIKINAEYANLPHDQE